MKQRFIIYKLYKIKFDLLKLNIGWKNYIINFSDEKNIDKWKIRWYVIIKL